MTLSIDASDQERVKLALGNQKHFFVTRELSENLLPEIKKFLKKSKIDLKQLKAIEVFPGPGHFSRTRTVVATANALAFALKLPQKLIKPVYDREPNITKPKKQS